MRWKVCSTYLRLHLSSTDVSPLLPAHSAAYEDAQVLHRDISGGNILIDKEGRGMLIDWDMCVWLENAEDMRRIGQPVVRSFARCVVTSS